MPNWCNNQVIIKGNKEIIDRIEKAYSKDSLCAEFIPVPKELLEANSPNTTNPEEAKSKYGYTDWYDFCVNKWGTKWDIGSNHGYGLSTRNGDESITLCFDSAWSPPMGLYDKLVDEGCEVEALYYEGGMCFFGRYLNGEDESGEFSKAEEIPDYIDDAFDVKESMMEYEQEEQ